MVFLKDFFENVSLKKKIHRQQKKHAKLPGMQRVNTHGRVFVIVYKWYHLYDFWFAFLHTKAFLKSVYS